MAKQGKTTKAIVKRIKLTKTGKIKHRACGQDHFNSRDNGKKSTNKKKDKTMSTANIKAIKQGFTK